MRKNKIAKIFAFALFCVLAVLQASFGYVSADISSSTTPTIVWHKEFSIGDFANNYNYMIQTCDGGYAMTGMAGSLNLGNIGPWLVKYDSAGNQQWSQPYFGQFKGKVVFSSLISGGANSLVQTRDGGYALGGRFNDGASIIKTDSEGNIQWNQTYPGVNDAKAVIKTSDDGFAVLGSKNGECWLGKVNSTGQLQWSQTYTNGKSTQAVAVIQTDEGGYAILVAVNPYLANAQALLIKTDSSGKPSWTRTYDFPKSFLKSRAFMQTSDGGYALAANLNDILCFVKTDSSGDATWNKTYSSFGNWAYSVIQTNDGGYALGSGSSQGPSQTGNLLKLDVSGNLQWNMTANGFVSSIVQTNDGHYTFSVSGTRNKNSSALTHPRFRIHRCQASQKRPLQRQRLIKQVQTTDI